jgi:hypothetical protein
MDIIKNFIKTCKIVKKEEREILISMYEQSLIEDDEDELSEIFDKKIEKYINLK